MTDSETREQVLFICELVKENRYDEAVDVLKSVNTDDILSSADLNSSIIFIEQTASDFIQVCLTDSNINAEKYANYVEQVGWFNQSIGIKDTIDNKQINIQMQILLNADILRNLVKAIDVLRNDDRCHRNDFVITLCIWLEAIAHFIPRHDNLIRNLIDPLRESVLLCVLSDWYRKYLTPSTETNIPARQFFIRTCSFVTGVLQSNQLCFEDALKTIQSYQVVETIGQQIFNVRLNDFRHYLLHLKDKNNDLKCLTGVCVLVTNCYNIKIFSNDHEYFDLLLQLLKSDFVLKNLLFTWTNDSTILANTVMVQLKNSSNEPSIQLYLQQNGGVEAISDYMHASYDRLRLQACMLLGVLLDNETIRKLNIPAKNLTDLYFDAIGQAHKSLNKSYKRVPIHLLFRALSSLVHNGMIQTILTASDNYFDYLVSISDDYNLVYDILWTLSFNQKFHQKFHSHKTLLERLQKFVSDPTSVFDKDVLHAAEGILWNLNNKSQNNSTTENSTHVEDKTNILDKVEKKSHLTENYKFDTMISYCWKEKNICKQIFDHLTQKGYRVWFDETNMHGNSVKAMANAIEGSKCIIVCMSANYERSNACHHEADYAYVLNRHLVPLVVQSGYKARDWLGFIIGSRIYIDFTKKEFNTASDMLEKEMTSNSTVFDDQNAKPASKLSLKNDESIQPVSIAYETKSINEWLSVDVVSWCRALHLTSLVELLKDFDGPCLVRLYNMSKKDGDDVTFRSLQVDFQNTSSNNQKKLSYTEFVRFQTELEKLMKKDILQCRPVSTNERKSAKICSLL